MPKTYPNVYIFVYSLLHKVRFCLSYFRLYNSPQYLRMHQNP
nr:MAG TPA: hypothetical protein [Caudoviricetes sp.]